jgi:hypothetical protein
VLWVAVLAVGCGSDRDGGQEQRQTAKDAPDTKRLVACLRDAGATVKEVAPPRHPGAEDKRLHAIFDSGYAGVFLIYRSSSAADQRSTELEKGQGAPVLHKGGIVLTYSGSSPVDATTKPDLTTLEDCLRKSGPGDDPPRGELGRQLSQIEARRDARSREYRSRQYNAPDDIRRELARLRSYRRYTLYYLGERHAGHELTSLNRRLQPVIYGHYTRRRLPKPSSPTFDFIYGTCKPPPGREGGCPPPLDVQNYEICARNPNSYEVPARSLTQRIRGVPYYMNQGAGAFELYTGTTTVVIFASDWEAAKRAAEQLRSIDGRIGPRSPLPAPATDALEGRLRCRPAPEGD